VTEFVPPGMVRMRVVDPTQHWDCPSHGSQRYEHQTDDAGVYIIVPLAGVKPLLRSGYAIGQ
jgi:hypothetical protein